eukprot:scaffold41913_cov54-Attheya_sp.AAC.2
MSRNVPFTIFTSSSLHQKRENINIGMGWDGLADTNAKSFAYVGYSDTEVIEGLANAQQSWEEMVKTLALVGIKVRGATSIIGGGKLMGVDTFSFTQPIKKNRQRGSRDWLKAPSSR